MIAFLHSKAKLKRMQQIPSFIGKKASSVRFLVLIKIKGFLKPGAPNENGVQNHLNVALLNVF